MGYKIKSDFEFADGCDLLRQPIRNSTHWLQKHNKLGGNLRPQQIFGNEHVPYDNAAGAGNVMTVSKHSVLKLLSQYVANNIDQMPEKQVMAFIQAVRAAALLAMHGEAVVDESTIPDPRYQTVHGAVQSLVPLIDDQRVTNRIRSTALQAIIDMGSEMEKVAVLDAEHDGGYVYDNAMIMQNSILNALDYCIHDKPGLVAELLARLIVCESENFRHLALTQLRTSPLLKQYFDKESVDYNHDLDEACSQLSDRDQYMLIVIKLYGISLTDNDEVAMINAAGIQALAAHYDKSHEGLALLDGIIRVYNGMYDTPTERVHGGLQRAYPIMHQVFAFLSERMEDLAVEEKCAPKMVPTLPFMGERPLPAAKKLVV